MNMITITISLFIHNHNRVDNGPCFEIFVGESMLIIYKFIVIIDHVSPFSMIKIMDPVLRSSWESQC